VFHVKHLQLADVLAWVGHTDPGDLPSRLERFESWLETEGVAAGGIGPDEVGVTWVRHILDSLMFARGITGHPQTILDLGSGVGLPGIPLALLFPRAAVTLVDRSRSRLELARRALRILDLPRVQTVQADFAAFSGKAEVVVMRAALPQSEAVPFLRDLVEAGGSAILGVGLSRGEDEFGLQERFPGSEVLDAGRWLHIMRG